MVIEFAKHIIEQILMVIEVAKHKLIEQALMVIEFEKHIIEHVLMFLDIEAHFFNIYNCIMIMCK